MKLAVVAALSLATAALAARPRCVSKAEAETLMTQWSQVMMGVNSNIGSANETAQAIIADDYYEVSDAVESLMQNSGVSIALGTVPTSAGKQANIAALLKNPVPQVNTIMTLVAGCDKIVWYWNMGFGFPGSQEVKGINIFTVKKNQLTNSYFEFNSIAWGSNTHQLPPQCYSVASSTTVS